MWVLGQAETIDLGTVPKVACGSWDRLRVLVNEVPDNRGGGNNLALHFTRASENLHSHNVKKTGKNLESFFPT